MSSQVGYDLHTTHLFTTVVLCFLHILAIATINKIEFVTEFTLVTAITTHATMIIENSSVNMQIRNVIPLGTQQIVFDNVKIENCVSKEAILCF